MKQFIVIGLGRFGSAVATSLIELGHEVLGIDYNEERVNPLKDKLTQTIQTDVTEERALKELGVNNFDAAIVCIGTHLEASILVTIMLKDLDIKYIIAKAHNSLHAKVLQKIGVDKIVFPERDMGRRIARSLIMPNIRDYIDLAPDHSVIEIKALPEFYNKNLVELNLPNKYGINVLTIKKGDNFVIPPTAKDVIKEGDSLIIIGETKKIIKLTNNGKN